MEVSVTKRQLSELRGAFAAPAKRSLRAPRYWGESEEAYHRRLNRLLQQTLAAAGVETIDLYLLTRMYDYAGHLVRALQDNPLHLTGLVLRFRDAQAKAAIDSEIGHQGHPGRFAPWNYERQFDAFFKLMGAHWQEVASDRSKWRSQRDAWISFIVKGRAAFRDSSGF